MLANLLKCGLLTRAELGIDLAKVGAGIAGIALEGLSAVAVLTAIEVVLIGLHFAHKRRVHVI